MSPGRRGPSKGIAYALTAYVLWGCFPVYFSWLSPTSALEIVAQRVVWCFVFMVLVLVVTRHWSWVRPTLRDRRRVGLLALAGTVIVLNWLTYNWAVNTNQAVEGSLGYFIAPLVTVTIGVVAFKERLRRTQWVAVGIAAFAVAVMTVETGRLPWIALVLAATFAVYGWIVKAADTPAVEAVTISMTAMVLPFLIVLIVLQANGSLVFGHTSTRLNLLLIGTGVVTAVPNLFFGGAATRVPLSTMGVLQYINPVLQFLCSVIILQETLSAGRWVGFVLVWVALVVFAADGWRQSRRADVVDPVNAEEHARP